MPSAFCTPTRLSPCSSVTSTGSDTGMAGLAVPLTLCVKQERKVWAGCPGFDGDDQGGHAPAGVGGVGHRQVSPATGGGRSFFYIEKGGRNWRVSAPC